MKKEDKVKESKRIQSDIEPMKKNGEMRVRMRVRVRVKLRMKVGVRVRVRVRVG